jgi:NitT/TauT family transport system permease protein
MNMTSIKSTENSTQGSVLKRGVFSISRWFNGLSQATAVSIVIFTVLITWELIVRIGGVSKIILPSPSAVGSELLVVFSQLAPGGFLAGELWTTVQEIMIGFALACGLGFAIGLFVGQTKFGQKAVMPLFVALEATPKIAFAPVFIAWFGFGISSKFIMAAFMSIFPVIIGTSAGLAATSEDELKLFKSMKAKSWDIFWKLKMLRALPFIFTGLKIAIVAALTGAIAAEFIGGGIGFGEQIRLASTRLKLDRVFALIFILSLMGILLFSVVAWIQNRVTFWDNPNMRTKAKGKNKSLSVKS